MKNIMQLCNCASVYGGNFIDSLCAIDEYTNYKNVYVFCAQAHHIHCQSWINELRKKGSPVYILTGNTLKDFFLLRTICKKHQICLIHTHFYYFKMFLYLYFLSFFQQVVIIHHFHNLDSYGKITQLLNNLFLLHTPYIGCSAAVKDNLKTFFPKNTVCDVTNAIGLSRLSIKGAAQKRNPHQFLMFGNEFYNKGVDIAIDAIQELRKQYPDVELVIVFSIDVEENKRRICKYLHQNQLPAWIHIYPPTQHIAQYYRQVAYFLSPSKSEGFCTSIAEAAYCGCQIIASDIPAQYQNHKNIPFIHFFPLKNRKLFVKTLKDAIEHPLSNLEQKEMKLYIEQCYDLRVWAEKIALIYNKYLSGSGTKLSYFK